MSRMASTRQGDLRTALVSYLHRLGIVVGDDETLDAIVHRTSSLFTRKKGFFAARRSRGRR